MEVAGGGGGGASTETFKLKIKQTTGGTISVDKEKVEKGKSVNITIKVDEGYEIEALLIDNKSVGAVEKYTLENIKKIYEISAKYKKLPKGETDPQNNSNENENNNIADNTDSQFIDVNKDDWFVDSVEYVVRNGLFKGVEKNKFAPNQSMTRAMIVTVLHRVAGTPTEEVELPFVDIDINEYYIPGLRWAYKNGIISGMTETTFGPNDNVTREQLVAILYRFASKQKYDTKINKTKDLFDFEDAISAEPYARTALEWAINQSLIYGRTKTELAPKGTATRAEVATIIMRFIQMYT